MLKNIFKHKLSDMQMQFVFFIVFIIIGTVYANIMADRHASQYQLIFDFFESRINEQAIVKTDLLGYLIISRYKLLIALWLIGFVIFTVYINNIITSFLGFSLGLIFSSALINNSFNGYGLMFLLILPQAVIYIPIYIYMTVKNSHFSKMFYKNKKVNKAFRMNGQLLLEYFLVLAICCVFMMVGIFMEAFVNPDLLAWYISLS